MSVINISQPGIDVRTANKNQLTLYTGYPFAKLDSTNDVSFQVINLSLTQEPPNPDGTVSTYQRNLVYQFAHGYNYVPSTWFMLSLNGFLTELGTEGVYITSHAGVPSAASAVFIVTVDATNVNFYIDKYWIAASGFGAPTIIGDLLSIRSYVFANDLSGTDIPAKP